MSYDATASASQQVKKSTEAGFSDKRKDDTQVRVRSHRPRVPLVSKLKLRFLNNERVSSEGDMSVRVT
jgi:hypothetical protein